MNTALHSAVGSSYEVTVQAEENERLLGTQTPTPHFSLGERKKMNPSHLGEVVVFQRLWAMSERVCYTSLARLSVPGHPYISVCHLQGLPCSSGTPWGRGAAGTRCQRPSPIPEESLVGSTSHLCFDWSKAETCPREPQMLQSPRR